MPISRLVAVSLSPASSVLSRTLARTGSVLRFETARLTTDRPRARFSCMTESFTSASLHVAHELSGCRHGLGGLSGAGPGSTRWARGRSQGRARSVVGIFSLSSHPVITVVTVWRRWTVTLPPAPIGGGRVNGIGGRHQARPVVRGGWTVEESPGRHPGGRRVPETVN